MILYSVAIARDWADWCIVYSMASTDNDLLLEEFRSLVEQDVAVPVCAMKTLVSVIKRSTSATWMQLEQELRSAINVLQVLREKDLCGRTNIFLSAGCDLFMKYVTRAFLEYTVTILCIVRLGYIIMK